MRKLRIILEMIKFEHTVFALPFAVMSAFIAADGLPSLDKTWLDSCSDDRGAQLRYGVQPTRRCRI